MRRAILIALTLVILLTGCAKQPARSPARPEFTPPPASKELSVDTYVIGIDHFDDGKVWGLNTEHGVYVVGPEVPDAMKTIVFEHLTVARDAPVTIRYREVPDGDGVVAHKRVTSMVIEEIPYLFIR